MRKVARLVSVSVLVRLGPILVAALLGAAGCGSDVASHDEAQRAATTWVEAHPDGWTVDIQSTGASEAFIQAPSANPCTNDLLWLQSSTEQGTISLFFDCPRGGEVVDFDWMKAHVRSYDIGLMTPDVGAPGWEFLVLPPSSSLTEGLTLESWSQGALSLRIETPFHTLGGVSKASSCALGADAPLPDDCWVEIPYTKPLMLTMKVPLTSDAFRITNLRQ